MWYDMVFVGVICGLVALFGWAMGFKAGWGAGFRDGMLEAKRIIQMVNGKE
jgi:hypothetical protein